MKKSRLIFVLPILLVLFACNKTHSSLDGSTSVLPSLPTEEPSGDLTSIFPSSAEPYPSLNNSSASNKVSNGTTSVAKGDSKYPIPSNKNNKFNIGDQNNRTRLDLQYEDQVSDKVNFMYGNNMVNVSSINFYSETVGGGIRFQKVNPGYGIQTLMFEDDWLKLEIDLEISYMTNHSSQDLSKSDSVFTINAYDENGHFIRSIEYDNFDTDMMNHTKKLYMSGINVSYLEFLCTNLPHKGNQFYNFGLKGIVLCGFPYEYSN